MSDAVASPNSSPEDRAPVGGGFDELADGLRAVAPSLGLQVVTLRSVDSTNRLGRRLVDRLAHELPAVLLVAWEQTAGRGRLGRAWASPGGLGAYQSLVHRIDDPARLGLLPLRVGIGLCRELRRFVPGLALKWPNDLITPRGKLGGILIEVVGQGGASAVVVGYGINVGHGVAEIPLPTATSLRLEGVDPLPALADLVPSLARAVRAEVESHENAASTLARYREVAAHRAGDRLSCTLGGVRYEGRLEGFDPAGRLLLRTDQGLRALSAADALEARGD
ncbi:MAG TPA: biotin--[acetyl-CoA-carboxylase] ligase [Thermoanaerobaculia bacterium]|nr:biotin--[acetyl-CoA-carboxylase] ligase [Thermoanaerobaculia bacterium]